MNDRIFDLYDRLEAEHIMLCFKGGLTPALIEAILEMVEEKLKTSEPNLRVRRRVFHVLLESLQNQYHHASPAAKQRGRGPDARTPSGQPADHQGLVMIAKTERGYSVVTGNSMAQAEMEALKERLDRVNASSPEELRKLYMDTLSDGRFSSSGGGGLGIIDMARRSGRKLEFNFVPLDRGSAFFSLNVNVPPQPNES